MASLFVLVQKEELKGKDQHQRISSGRKEGESPALLSLWWLKENAPAPLFLF